MNEIEYMSDSEQQMNEILRDESYHQQIENFVQGKNPEVEKYHIVRAFLAFALAYHHASLSLARKTEL